MLAGLLCISASILARFIVRSTPLLDEVSTGVGYFGLFLIFVGFFIQILSEE
jgi:hypothetical protein